MTATCVSISGIVSWVGLFIPHIVRMLVGLAQVVHVVRAHQRQAEIARNGQQPGVDDSLLLDPFFALVLARSRQAWF